MKSLININKYKNDFANNIIRNSRLNEVDRDNVSCFRINK